MDNLLKSYILNPLLGGKARYPIFLTNEEVVSKFKELSEENFILNMNEAGNQQFIYVLKEKITQFNRIKIKCHYRSTSTPSEIIIKGSLPSISKVILFFLLLSVIGQIATFFREPDYTYPFGLLLLQISIFTLFFGHSAYVQNKYMNKFILEFERIFNVRVHSEMASSIKDTP